MKLLSSVRVLIASMLSVLLIAGSITVANAAQVTEIRKGEARFYVQEKDGAPQVTVREMKRGTHTDHQPGSVVLVVGEGAFTTDFKGNPSLGEDGAQGYQANWSGLRIGFGSGYAAETQARFELDTVSGPGRVAVFNDPDSETDKLDGYQQSGEVFLKNGSKLDAKAEIPQWFFTHSGTYTLNGHAVVGEKKSQPFTVKVRVEKSDEDKRGEGNTATAESEEAENEEAEEAENEEAEEAAPAQTAPAPANTDRKVTLVDGHTDFYVYQGDNGKPTSMIKHGINTFYTYENTDIVFSAETYSNEYNFKGLGEDGKEGYYDRPDVKNYMSPGFSNAYGSSAKINFNVTEFDGPGKIALFDNPINDEDPRIPYLANHEYFIKKGSDIPIPGHRHVKWFITHAGTYKITGNFVVTQNNQTTKSEPYTISIRVNKHSDDKREAAAPQTGSAPQTPPKAQSPASTPSTKTRTVELVKNHTDVFFVQDVNGKPTVSVRNGIGNDDYDPNKVTLVIGDDAYTTDFEDNEQLGVDGAEGYYAVYGERNFMHPGVGNDYKGAAQVKMKFDKVQGPGKIAVFFTGEDEGSPLEAFLSDGKFFMETGGSMPIPGHQHMQWFFTHAGTYYITAHAEVTKNGVTTTSEPITVSFRVDKSVDDKRPDVAPVPDPAVSGGFTGQPQNPPSSNPPVVPTPQPRPIVEGKTVIDRGHVDLLHLSPAPVGLKLDAKDDSSGSVIYRKPEDFVLRVPQSTYQEIRGKMGEQTVAKGYYLPENGTNQETVVFPGWDSEQLVGYTGIGYKFLKVTGPGRVFLMKNKALGGVQSILSTGAELKDGSVLNQERAAHEHAHWIFEKPGTYTMQVQGFATTPAGVQVLSNIGTYTWIIGEGGHNPIPPNPGGENKDEPQEPSGGNPTDPNKFDPSNVCVAHVIKGAGGKVLRLQVKDDSTVPARWLSTSDIAFAIGDAGKATAPSQIGGIAAGSQVWMISSTQVRGVPWVGMNTQSQSIIEGATGSTTVTLTGFSGPGKMEVFTSGNFGQLVGERWFSGANGSGSGSITLGWNTHVHPNWVFDTPGQYKVTLRMTTTTKDGKTVSGSGTVVFNVGGGAGVTDGHFDLGPVLGAAGDKTVWLDGNGNPCTPSHADLLANTGASDAPLANMLATAALLLLLASVAVIRARRYTKIQ